MLLFPFAGLGLVKRHTFVAAALAGNSRYRCRRNCIFRECHSNSNSCPYDKESRSREKWCWS